MHRSNISNLYGNFKETAQMKNPLMLLKLPDNYIFEVMTAPVQD